MLGFKEYISEEYVAEATEAAMRAWAMDKIENSDMAHDEIKKEFIKKYGMQNVKIYDKAVDDAAGY